MRRRPPNQHVAAEVQRVAALSPTRPSRDIEYFAQCAEDLILASLLRATDEGRYKRRELRYLDVGANPPSTEATPTCSAVELDRPFLERFLKREGYRHATISRVIPVPVLPLDALIAEHFGDRGPDLLSVDVEGLDYESLPVSSRGDGQPI